MEWDVGGGEEDLEEFGITTLRGVQREAAERSRWRHDEEAYMEGVRREHLGSAYMEEPRRTLMDTVEEMEVAAVGVRGGRRWEARSTSRPAFMVSKAADAAVWEDLKDIKPPMYDGNPLNLDRFLEKLDDWGMTVTEGEICLQTVQVPPAGGAPRALLHGDQGGENRNPQGSQEVAQRAGAGGRSAGGCQAVEVHQASA